MLTFSGACLQYIIRFRKKMCFVFFTGNEVFTRLCHANKYFLGTTMSNVVFSVQFLRKEEVHNSSEPVFVDLLR